MAGMVIACRPELSMGVLETLENLPAVLDGIEKVGYKK
jgi:hypothetical protein